MSDPVNDTYTKVPNAVFEAMATLGNAELRVLLAITRKTAGWGKECDVISISQLATMTGLTSRNAQNAVTALLDKGYITREHAGKQTYCYMVKPYPVGTQLDDHIPTDTISPRDTEPYPLGTRNDTKPYPLGITQKKDLKEKKERDVAPRKARVQRPSKNDTTPAVVRTTLADVCGLDLTVCSREQKLNLNTTAKRLYLAGEKAGKTPEETASTIRYVAGYFKRVDWRGKKGDTPTPKQLVDSWGAAIQARQPPAPNGHSPPVPATPDALPLDEVFSRIAREGFRR